MPILQGGLPTPHKNAAWVAKSSRRFSSIPLILKASSAPAIDVKSEKILFGESIIYVPSHQYVMISASVA